MRTPHLILAVFAFLSFSAAPLLAAETDATTAQLNQALADAKSNLNSLQEEIKANKDKVAEAQKDANDAKAEKDASQANRDALAAQQAQKPNPDTERKLKDTDYEIMMADQKLSSANKTLERAQKKLDGSLADEKSLQAQIAKAEKAVNEQKATAEKAKATEAKAVDVAAQKAAEEKAKAAEEKARKEAEARAAAEQEAAKKAANAEAQAKEEQMKKELGIDSNCVALPTAPTKPATEMSALDKQLQQFAMGELRRVNRLLDEKIEGDKPMSPQPELTGSKLKPCTIQQKQALRFSYLGNGQYRLETPVLAGEQDFQVANLIDPIQRTIPESDNGETYVFFLDVKYEGRYKLSLYKKSLFEQAAQQ